MHGATIAANRVCVEKLQLCFGSALKIFRDEVFRGAGAIRGGTLDACLLICTISVCASSPSPWILLSDSTLFMTLANEGLPWTSHLYFMADLYGLHANHWSQDYFTDPPLRHLFEVMGVMD